MKRVLFTLVGLAVIGLVPADARAGRRACKQRCNNVQNVQQLQQFAITPFVAAIGVPVASYSAMAYQSGGSYSAVGYTQRPAYQSPYQQPQAPLRAAPAPTQGCGAGCQCGAKAAAQTAMTAEQIEIEQLSARLAQLKAKASGAALQAQAPPSLIVQNCASCHNGTAAVKPGIVTDFTNPTILNCEQRMAAIQRILADHPERRMPQGRTLDPQTIGLLIQELSRELPPSPGPADEPQAGEPGVPVSPAPKLKEIAPE